MSKLWGYGPDNGPDKWAHLGFPIAMNGKRQSPIDLPEAGKATADDLAPLHFTYVPDNTEMLKNNGRTIEATVNGKGSLLSGGPLGADEYELKQFHFHWGSHNAQGSEHTVDGRKYSAEVHLVHWNRSRFDTFEEAVMNKDGLAVLSVLVKYGVR
jgi:carbonic anhydrase